MSHFVKISLSVFIVCAAVHNADLITSHDTQLISPSL